MSWSLGLASWSHYSTWHLREQAHLAVSIPLGFTLTSYFTLNLERHCVTLWVMTHRKLVCRVYPVCAILVWLCSCWRWVMRLQGFGSCWRFLFLYFSDHSLNSLDDRCPRTCYEPLARDNLVPWPWCPWVCCDFVVNPRRIWVYKYFLTT